jgi:hypothetical protein
MEEKIFNIYILKDMSDNIKYVGITTQSLKTRLTKHYYDVKTNKTKNKHKISWFKKNINKILIEKIDEAYNKKDAFDKEKFYINKYSKENKLINKTLGGEGCYGYKHSKKTIDNMKGLKNHRFGKSNIINKHLFGQKVEYSTNMIDWKLCLSIGEASKETGVCKKTISKMCKGDMVFNKNIYYFRFEGSEYKLLTRKKNNQSIRKVPIEAFIDNKWIKYNSAIDASVELGVDRTKIIMVCKGKRNKTGGIIFRYLENN